MKIEYKLGRIHCAGCAQSLEEILSSTDGIDSVSLDFISGNMVVESNSMKKKELEEVTQKAIHRFDRNITISDPHAEEKLEKKDKIKSIINYSIILITTTMLILLNTIHFESVASLILYILCYILISYNVLLSAFFNIIRGQMLDETFLMSIASIGAFIIGEYTEAVAVMLLYNIGELFQNRAVKKSEKEIKSITKLKATYANLVLDNTEMQVTLDKVTIGDTISIKQGEKVPLDGKIISGDAYVNTSAITGESAERFLKAGDPILSGSIVSTGNILVEVTSNEQTSTVSRIIELVEKASLNKSKTEKFIAKFAKWYTPIVVGMAAIIAFIIPIFSLYQDFALWAYRALLFLVVSCPCALVISVPLSFFAGIGASAKHGIMIKGANYMEALWNINTFIFDKTGTLTYGNFSIKNIAITNKEKSKDEILELIAYAENFSNHRIAKSIIQEYNKRTHKDINIAWIEGAREVPGEGVIANIFGIDCIVGNAKLLKDNNISFVEVDSANTIVYLAENGKLSGYVEIADSVKPEAKEVVLSLKKLGINEISMFTGDNDRIAKNVADDLGLDCYHANLLPEDKVNMLAEHNHGNNLAFVGDGINDAPILSTVNVGIAMGGIGSDIAIESSDVVLMDDNLSRLPLAISIAKNTKKIVYENIIFSIGIKILVLVLSILGFANMWLAIFADVGVTLIAILNSIRVLFVNKKYKQKLDKIQS